MPRHQAIDDDDDGVDEDGTDQTSLSVPYRRACTEKQPLKQLARAIETGEKNGRPQRATSRPCRSEPEDKGKQTKGQLVRPKSCICSSRAFRTKAGPNHPPLTSSQHFPSRIEFSSCRICKLFTPPTASIQHLVSQVDGAGLCSTRQVHQGGYVLHVAESLCRQRITPAEGARTSTRMASSHESRAGKTRHTGDFESTEPKLTKGEMERKHHPAHGLPLPNNSSNSSNSPAKAENMIMKE